ncbi:hypothetical protein DRW42_28180 [Pedobacter miscanthi]|uniref:Uncharacterized protein n=1 Tax=Pedobacter miscanthi TaxID=2259170 RepID=A0A366KJN7_9SPHI|nr:hypothetical protein DRW42_28180 [Pedobacter miscanthi]
MFAAIGFSYKVCTPRNEPLLNKPDSSENPFCLQHLNILSSITYEKDLWYLSTSKPAKRLKQMAGLQRL